MTKTLSGLDLPVIDITDPAFALQASPVQLEAEALAFEREQQAKGAVGRFVQKLLMPVLLKKTTLGRGLIAARGSYLSGLSTYILKLNPGNLRPPYDSAIEKKICASFAGHAARQRLQDIAELSAEALRPLLAAEARRPLHLVNIAGGPCSDSLNTLALLQSTDPGLLPSRAIQIHCLDLDSEGPDFAAKSLAELQGPSRPLHGLDIQFDAIPYNWSDPAPLVTQLTLSQTLKAIVLVSSEGGLFDYGSDADVANNLSAIQHHSASDTQVTGTLSLPVPFNHGTGATLSLRTMESFAAFAASQNWSAAESRTRPSNTVFRLKM